VAGYTYTPYPDSVVDRWDWPAAAAAYKERADNEAHNARIWRGRYEALAKKVGA
jgi:hypothetical protein